LFQNYAPTTFNRYISETTVANRRVRFTIWDTAGGREEANSTRALACREADVLLLCYKISDPASLFNAINHWVPELRLHAPTTPVLLVGCQSDMRTDAAVISALAKVGRSPVSAQQALSMSQQVQAAMYVETSSRVSSRSVATAMELAALTALGQVTPPPLAAQSLSGPLAPLSTETPPSAALPAAHPLLQQNRNIHHRQSSLLLLPSSPSASSSSSVSSQSSPSPMISSKKHRNRSLSMTRHQLQNRSAGPATSSSSARTTVADLLSARPVSVEEEESPAPTPALFAIEPSETFWKQFSPPVPIASYSTDIISLHSEGGGSGPQEHQPGAENGSPLAVRLSGEAGGTVAAPRSGLLNLAESPRSPLLSNRAKMGSLSSMSMRSKSSTLSSTKSDTSMLSLSNIRSSSSSAAAHNNNVNNSSGGGGGGVTSTTVTTHNNNHNHNNHHTISITTRTPKAGRKTPKKNNSGSGEPEKMIRIRCQRLREDRTYEEVDIEVPAPVYETMQAYTESGAAGGTPRKPPEKRASGLGTKIKCLFSKTAS